MGPMIAILVNRNFPVCCISVRRTKTLHINPLADYVHGMLFSSLFYTIFRARLT